MLKQACVFAFSKNLKIKIIWLGNEVEIGRNGDSFIERSGPAVVNKSEQPGPASPGTVTFSTGSGWSLLLSMCPAARGELDASCLQSPQCETGGRPRDLDPCHVLFAVAHTCCQLKWNQVIQAKLVCTCFLFLSPYCSFICCTWIVGQKARVSFGAMKINKSIEHGLISVELYRKSSLQASWLSLIWAKQVHRLNRLAWIKAVG